MLILNSFYITRILLLSCKLVQIVCLNMILEIWSYQTKSGPKIINPFLFCMYRKFVQFYSAVRWHFCSKIICFGAKDTSVTGCTRIYRYSPTHATGYALEEDGGGILQCNENLRPWIVMPTKIQDKLLRGQQITSLVQVIFQHHRQL